MPTFGAMSQRLAKQNCFAADAYQINPTLWMPVQWHTVAGNSMSSGTVADTINDILIIVA